MLQSSLVAWPRPCGCLTNAWTSHSKTAYETSTWRGWLAGRLSTLHRKEEATDKKPCPSIGAWSLARNRSRNGHEVFQDLWHFKCFGWDRRLTSSRPKPAKARVTQMASKLYCQLKAPYKATAFRSHQFYKSSLSNSFNLCLLFIGTWLQANSGICVTFGFFGTFGFDLWEKKKFDQTLSY